MRLTSSERKMLFNRVSCPLVTPAISRANLVSTIMRAATREDHAVGLIRKTLAVGSLGLVRGSSKKQRVAKAQLLELRAQTQLMQEQADALAGQADPLDSPVAEVRAAELRRINAQNESMNLRPTERQQQVQVLWGLYNSGVLTREQYTTAYEALGEPASA